MHETARRLYEAADAIGRLTIPAKVAIALGESQQTLKHWEKRGVSQRGMVNACALWGLNMTWLKSGSGLMLSKSSQEAHGVSYQPLQTPPITKWEDLVKVESMPALPADLMLEVPDNALAPRGLSKGQHIWFKAASAAEPRNVVLIEANGRRYIRRYAEDAQGPFAQALDDAYPSFREFKVVAVMHMRPESSI